MPIFRRFVLLCALFLLAQASLANQLVAALDDFLPPIQTQTEHHPPANEEDDSQADAAQRERDTDQNAALIEPDMETPEEPLESQLPAPENADIRQQVQKLRDAYDSRQNALANSKKRLAFAESLLDTMNNEYQSFELRLEKAGLNLTDDYANLLRQRLERLSRQTIAAGLTEGIRARLSAAREEQLRLEEFEAVIDPSDDIRGQLEAKRAQLLRQLHGSVTEHIQVLNQYYNTVIELRERLNSYQELLQQRLFWLPSTDRVTLATFNQLFQGATWFLSGFQWPTFKEAFQASLQKHWPQMMLFSGLLIFLLVRRRGMRRALKASAQHVGDVGQDRWGVTLYALTLSLLCALPWVILLSLGYLMLESGNDFLHALSRGLSNAAFTMLLLRIVYTAAYRNGLGECHFQWRPVTLRALRQQIPILLAVLIPIVIIMPTMSTAAGSIYSDSLGRVLFAVASGALSYFAHYFMSAVRTDQPHSRALQGLHWLAVGIPPLLILLSLWGYHYTAVQIEGLLFISICWLAFVILLHYLGLRGLAVRGRRIAFKRIVEHREAERKLADTREAAETSGEGVPQSFEMPQQDIHDISQQSQTLLKITSFILAALGLWMLWDNIFPALKIFDTVTLWTISSGIEGQTAIPIKVGDLMLALGLAIGTIVAARNLPGTLEIVFLSRLNLEPGVGYAITTLATYIIVLIGIAAALATLGVQWAKLQWLVAALGLGLGFGLQEIVANFVSGIILLFERPIRVGDTVTISGITGTVSRIRIRATTLMDWDRKEQIIPNKTFVTQDLTNWTLSDRITRVIIRVGVAYGSDPDRVRELLHQVAIDNDRVVDEPAPAVFCVGLGDSSIDFEVRVFVRDLLDFMPLSHELHAAITHALQAAGIAIPFPQRDIHIRAET